MSHNTHQLLVQAYTDWLIQEVRQDRIPYYLNIMFHPLKGGSHEAIISQMQQAIYNCFYPALCKQCARHPHRKSQESLLPRAWLFADLPYKVSNEGVNLNRGLHYNGCFLFSDKSRLDKDLCHHIQRHQHLYVESIFDGRRQYRRGGIKFVHAVSVDRTPRVLTDYAMKTVKSGKVSYDTTIILPRLASELKSSPITLDAKSRAIKDIQAQTNASDQLAERLYSMAR
jgi:hypothetical protein